MKFQKKASPLSSLLPPISGYIWILKIFEIQVFPIFIPHHPSDPNTQW